MNRMFSLVGRAGFEPATNGLKVRRAHRAEVRIIGEPTAHGAPKVPELPRFCQFLPPSLIGRTDPGLRDATAKTSTAPSPICI
jgi:hypothetical protein